MPPLDAVKRFLRRILLTPEGDRLRTLWRLLLFILLYTVLQAALTGVLFLVWPRSHPLPNGLWVGEALAAASVTLSVAIARRWIDRRSFASLGLAWSRRALRDLLFGIALTGILLGLVLLGEMALGWLRVRAFVWEFQRPGEILAWLGEALLLWVLVAWVEELLFRGYLLTNLRDGLNTTWAVVISSLLFALAHAGNPGFTWQAFVGLTLAGLFLADGWLTTQGGLWLPIGLHIGWNLFEGTIYGFPVSGLDLPRLLVTSVSGPPLFTGGAFGPEAGLVIVPALALGAAWMHWRARRASH